MGVVGGEETRDAEATEDPTDDEISRGMLGKELYEEWAPGNGIGDCRRKGKAVGITSLVGVANFAARR